MPRIHIQTSALSTGRQEISIQLPPVYDDSSHLELILDAFNINPDHSSQFYISCNGHVLQNDDLLEIQSLYRLTPRLRGGKGGFGSMLRAIGAQIEKTTSREACRDLSGRRMRDVNNEKKLKDWVSKQADRETEKQEKKRERRERQKHVPEHKFSDRQYDEQKAIVKDNLEDALQQGLNRSAPVSLDSRKRKSNEGEDVCVNETKRRAAEWLGLDIDELSDLGSSDESDADAEDAYFGACPMPLQLPLVDSDGNRKAGSSAGSNMSTAVQFSDVDSKASSEWENPDHFVDVDMVAAENGSDEKPFEVPIHSDDLLERLGNSPSEKGECSRSEAGSIRSERGECSTKSEAGSLRSERGEYSKSEAGSIRSERGECSRSDAGSFVSDLSHWETKSSKSVNDSELHKEVIDLSIVLEDFERAEDLHSLGLDRLKSELMSRGLKCGGTLEQRAERLFSVKGLSPDQYNPSIVSKGGKSKSSQR